MKPFSERDISEIHAAVGNLWEGVRDGRVFLTGGTGFFGRWLIESFVAANVRSGLNARLTVLSRSPEAFLGKYPWLRSASDVEWVAGDIRDFEFPTGDFTHVIHAATPVIAARSPEDAKEVLSIILAGSARLLAFCEAKRPRRVLLVSSGAIYGAQPETLTGFPETWSGAPDPSLPASAYGEGKRASETLAACSAACSGFGLRIARCFAFVGPGLPLDTHFAAGNFIRDILDGNPPSVKGNPDTVRSYLYASDLTAWLWRHLLGEGEAVINVGSDDYVTLGELAGVLASAYLGENTGAGTGGTPGNRYTPDVSRALQQGHRILVGTREAFDRTIAYHQYIRS